MAFKLNHYAKRQKQGRDGVVGLEIDAFKVYNQLEWGFIGKMLYKFGFNQTWISIIVTCVSTVAFNFLQNGFKFRNIHSQRGIRKGVPISSYIYI